MSQFFCADGMARQIDNVPGDLRLRQRRMQGDGFHDMAIAVTVAKSIFE